MEVIQHTKYNSFLFVFFENYPPKSKCSNVFRHVWCIILNIGFGFCVFDSIWEHRLNEFLNIFSNNFQTCPSSVNNFRTDYFFEMFWDLWS